MRFASETGVGAARAAVRNYQLLMKDLAAPLDAVMTAPARHSPNETKHIVLYVAARYSLSR